MIDWKKVAKERLRLIKGYRHWKDMLSRDMAQRVYRHAFMVLGARCVGDAHDLAEEIAASIAKEIAAAGGWNSPSPAAAPTSRGVCSTSPAAQRTGSGC